MRLKTSIPSATLPLLVAILIWAAWVSTLPDHASATTETEPWLETLFDPDLEGRRPEELAWRPGTRQLSYWWDVGGMALWLEDVASGDKRQLLTLAALGVDKVADVDWHGYRPDGQAILLGVKDELRLLDVERGELRLLVATSAEQSKPEEPKFSPDGARLAFVRGVELYLLNLTTGEERRLTHDGEPEVMFNGITDWVYWEEIWGRSATGFWWSGDGERIAYYHFDDSEVPVYPLIDARPLHPQVEEQRYPKAGDPLPKVEVRVLELASGRTVRLQLGAAPEIYTARVAWHGDGRWIAVQRLTRDQNRLDLLLCSAVDGSCSTLLSETWPTWINLGDEFAFLPDGRFLWSSEKSGWRQLYLYDGEGRELRQLSSSGWALTAVEKVDPSAGWVVYSAYATTPLGAAERHVFRVGLDSGEPRQLTAEEGWNEALVHGSGDWVHTWSDADTPPRQVLRYLDQERSRPLPALPAKAALAELPKWERFTIPGPEGSKLPVQLLKPRGFEPDRRYPVLTYHYGGPASQVVENRWRSRGKRYLWHKLMAERGYVSFALDNQASRFFGKQGEDRVYRRFGEIELAGQLAGVAYLKTLPWIDGERLGLWGWSGGGSNTLYSLLRRPGVWRAGVAGAPVTDWRLYDAIWMERYLDRPQDNTEGYKASSPMTYAGELRDPLLLVHGTTDNNVHPQNTLNLIARFIAEGVKFELALYPNVRHSLQTFDEASQRDFFRRLTDFFDRHLRRP